MFQAQLFIAHAHTCSQLKFTPSCQVGFPMCFSGCVFNSHRSFSRPKEKFLFRVVNLRGANHLLFFLFFLRVNSNRICPLQQLQRHFMPHSALCSVPCSVECFLQLPSKIPEWNYKVVLLWRVCTACCCEYFQVPPCIRPFMSGFDPSLCCKDNVCWEPFFLYWSVSEISTYTVTVEMYGPQYWPRSTSEAAFSSAEVSSREVS